MTSPYPYAKVILGFTLFGGALGGTLVFFYGMMEESDFSGLLTTALFSFIYIGVLFGTAPSLCTGLWLAWRRKKRTLGGLLEAALAGAAITALIAVGMFSWANTWDERFWLYLSIVAGLAAIPGAVCAVILGAIFLPRSDTL